MSRKTKSAPHDAKTCQLPIAKCRECIDALGYVRPGQSRNPRGRPITGKAKQPQLRFARTPEVDELARELDSSQPQAAPQALYREAFTRGAKQMLDEHANVKS